MRPRIFVSQPIPESALVRLRAVGEVEVGADVGRMMPKHELTEAIRRNDHLFHLMHDVIDVDMIAANSNLKVIASMSIIPASLDVAAATARRIPVTTIPPIVTEATADLTWALLLAVARRIPEADRVVRSGMFPGSQSMRFTGGAVARKAIGIIGLGRIGRAVARRAQGFGMSITYTDPRRPSDAEERELGVVYAPLDDLLRQSDFICLTAALTPDTYHLVGARQLSLMKPTAYFVNTSRGPMVDEAALVAALKAGRIAGAALDVFEQEPSVHPDLLTCDNVVLSAHMGSAVAELREQMAHLVVDNILAVINGERPPNLYNPEIYGAAR